MFKKLFSSENKETEVNWKKLESVSTLEDAIEASHIQPVLLFKHSTSCSISGMALSRFERSFSEDAAFAPYFLDLLANRQVSNAIEEKLGVRHESPQALLIKDGKVVSHASHNAISFSTFNEVAKKDQ